MVTEVTKKRFVGGLTQQTETRINQSENSDKLGITGKMEAN